MLIKVQHQKYYWETKAEIYRLDAIYYETKYDNCREKQNEILYKLYEKINQ